MDLITLLVICIVLAIVFYILTRYVIPLLPKPWGTILLVVIALLVVIYLLTRIGVLTI